jgi:hypothetical protein
MKKLLLGCGVLVVICLLAAVIIGFSFVGVWNNLNEKYQGVNGAKSRYSVALNNLPQELEAVWTMCNQYMEHESKVFKDYAEARSRILPVIDAFKAMAADPKTKDGDLAVMGKVITDKLLPDLQKAMLAVNVTVENNPNLKAIEGTKESMRTAQVVIQQIKTAADDWVTGIQNYNTYRGSFWPSMVGGFMPKFPAQIDYYEGKVKELDIKSLNPAGKTGT